MKRWRNPAALVLVYAIKGYQRVLSPLLPRSCKYYPSCSQYAVEALREFGVFRGIVLAAWRVLRCNPLSYGGYDPVSRQKLFAPRGERRTMVGTTGGA
jgi:putative membrane protein insertion efficiency factor